MSDLLDATLSVAHDVKKLMVKDVGIALASLIQGFKLHTWRYSFAFGIVFCKKWLKRQIQQEFKKIVMNFGQKMYAKTSCLLTVFLAASVISLK